MTRDEAKEVVKQNLPQYLQMIGINPGRPFKCLNPEHNDSHPSMSIDKNSRSGLHCKCFSCNAYYDTFDLIGIEYGITDEQEIFEKGYELFHLDIDGAGKSEQNGKRMERNTHNSIHTSVYTQSGIEELKQSPVIDFTREVMTAHEELMKNEKALSYIRSRGIGKGLIEEYSIGYSEKGYNHLLKDHKELQRKSKKENLYKYVFPYKDTDGRYTYFLTEISDRNEVDSYNGKYGKIAANDSGIVAQLFNERYIKQDEVPEAIFICEGIYDALSVEEVGGKAIAFSGTAHRRFLSLCKEYKPKTTFIISLDNDGAGQSAMDAVKIGLDELSIPYIIRTAASGKDFNDDLKADRGAFSDFIQQILSDVNEAKNAAEKAEREAYLQTSTAYHLQSFIDDIEKSKDAAFFSTGFESVDKVLDGGLYSGLYCVGAISSLGKTTFCLQVIDNIAKSGHDCLIFSLEMARTELIAKSVSRLTFTEDLRKNGSTAHAKTTRGITSGSRYKNYSQEERQLIADAIGKYSEYADHIYIHEGVGNIGVDMVRQKVEQHIRITGNKPVILIDYLQIMSPYNEHFTDKQNTDKSVLELKRISRDFSIPVICISSFNRDNYTAPVNMASFKESGAVEYSSDVLLALQYDGMEYVSGEKEQDRQKRIRDLMNSNITKGKEGKPLSIQIKILKNRNGSKGDALIDFYPMFNYFTEKGKSGVGFEPQTTDGEWVQLEGVDLFG